MTVRMNIGHLPDDLEEIFYRSRSLESHNISRLSPLGTLYLLITSEKGPEVAALVGRSTTEMQETALSRLAQLYPLNGNFNATEETSQLIDSAVTLSGAFNAAKVSHFLLAMLADDARHTDAYTFLTQLGVTQDTVRQNMEAMNHGVNPLLDSLTTDFSEETRELTEPILESPYHVALMDRILSHLNKRSLPNVLLSGFPGVGRRTLLRQIVRKIDADDLESFQGYQFRKLNWTSIIGLRDPQNALEELTKELDRTILVVDYLTAARFPLVLPLFDSKTPVVAIATSAEEKKFASELAGRAITVRIDEPKAEIVNEILQLHMQEFAAYHHLAEKQSLNKQELEMLTRLGPSISGLSLPGGAVHLLDLAASHDSLVGDQDLSSEDIAFVIHQSTGISVGTLTQTELERFARVPELLDRRIIGQKSAKDAITNSLNRAQTGLRDPKKPLAVLAFLGPTGVGKTETAKALAEALFDDEDLLIRIDLSEYQAAHTTSRLIGSPPGYVGYEEGGQLTDAVSRRPFSVILFDEADKAHPDVYNLLLQMMDDGRLTDGRGRTVDFRNTVILFTSNHGSSMILQGIQNGKTAEEIESDTIGWFQGQVRPEFFNRLDEIIVFHPINEQDAHSILDLQLARLIQDSTRSRYGIEVELSAEAKSFVHRYGYSREFGGRPLQRAINRYIGTPLSTILLGDLTGTTRISVEKDATEEKLQFFKR